ncbi:MAG: GNAT family N-acetyltransferase [Candidatus Hodarchaeota archaeon]
MSKSVKYSVRNYKKGDEIELAKILSECFGPITPKQLLQWYSQERVNPEDVFVAEVDGKLVSTVEIISRELHVGEKIYLRTGAIAGVCTDSDYRKKGIATSLMKKALELKKSKGISSASLYTELDNPARRVYERLGFIDLTTFRTFVKYLDFHSFFTNWIRMRNRRLKDSKIAKKKLEGWEKTIVIDIKEVGTLSFQFKKGRFRVLRKVPKRIDIEFSTDLQTYTKIWWNVLSWEEAVKDKILVLKQGKKEDIELFKRFLHWRWGD